MFQAFSIARLPRIEFGSGATSRLPGICRRYGRRLLLVTGERSLRATPHWGRITAGLKAEGLGWDHFTVDGEPSPELVDRAVQAYRNTPVDTVVGIGGGSALDAAKAIAGLLRVRRSVLDYLEGVGPERAYEGPAVPFIAVPTTAGTGSEATKNAVLSLRGPQGFKKSFRDERLVAQYAVVDPQLLASCPREVIAANGMDALTQLIESYVSIRANPFTDSLAIGALRAARDGLLDWYEGGAGATQAREAMAYAALVSGITLAQTGLGSVHGLASPLGAYYPIPHGVACGTLVAAATEINIRAMHEREPDNPALARYARLGEVLCRKRYRDLQQAREALVEHLREWTERLNLPPLSRYGLDSAGIDKVVAHARGSSMKTNPIVLSDGEIRELVEARL